MRGLEALGVLHRLCETRIYDDDARRSLSQYIVRAPLSLTLIQWDEQQDTVTWKAPQKGFYKGTERHFSCLARGRGTWKARPAIASRAPKNRYTRQAAQPPAAGEPTEDQGVSASDSRKAWVRHWSL
jgi:hypothetical protein